MADDPGADDERSGADGDAEPHGGEDPAAWWDEVYERDDSPPWDIGRPQPAFADLAESGAVEGRVLDAGSGTGTHALWAAERGHPVVGADVSEAAVERARAAADDRGLDAAFVVADALDLPADLGPFDTVLDSGLFHAFESDQRDAYADGLAAVVRPGGRVFVLGFGEGAPEDWGPNPFAPADVRAAFGEGWTVRDISAVEFETREASVPGLLGVVERDAHS
ncbi:class I SAM-dependent methyltransferase [Halorussus sp. AFM4]|uniref:class I SAM-dependent methyltransferase n=1 Tax=Halorussus sp. AFM4 TaxID=3421651 RepID=UPI003EBFFC38